MTVFMLEDDIWYRAWSFGLDSATISWLARQDHGCPKQLVDQHIVLAMKSLSKRRTRSQLKRFIVRRRRAYNHDRAVWLLHERAVLRARDGMRCYTCKHIPPQPGEIMEETE